MSDRKLRFSAQAASSYRLWCLSAEAFLHQFMRLGVGVVAFNLLNADPCVVWNSGERFVNSFFATVVLRNRAHVQHTPGSLSHVEFESGSTECDTSKQTLDQSLGVNADRLGRRHAWQAGHRPDCAADGDDKACPGRQPDIAHRHDVAGGRAKQRGVG